MNKKTNKRIRSLYGHELKQIIDELGLRGYSKFTVPQKKEALIKEVDCQLLLRTLWELDFVKDEEVEWKWKWLRKSLQWKQREKASKVRQKVHFRNNNVPPIYKLLSLFIFSTVLFYFKPSITYGLFDYFVCEHIGRRDETKKVELVIDLNNQVYKDKNHYETEIKNLLADKVLWFKPPEKPKEKINFGTREYDKFCFCEKPEKLTSSDNYQQGNFKISVLGAYRFNTPKEKLYRVQRIKAEVENELITSITSLDEEEDILESVNDLYQNFWVAPFFLSLGIFIYLFVFSKEDRADILSFFKVLLRLNG